MNDSVELLLLRIREAIGKQDWKVAISVCRDLLRLEPANVNGHFLIGLVLGNLGQTVLSEKAFSRALMLDNTRVDAALQLARCKSMLGANASAEQLVDSVYDVLPEDASLLDLAATIYSLIGRQEKAWPLYVRVSRLKENSMPYQCNIASCAIFLGKADIAKTTLSDLLCHQPHYYKAHWLLSKLAVAQDCEHINTMKGLLEEARSESRQENLIHYALGKEYEDLKQWKKAWHHYQAGAALTRANINYNSKKNSDLVSAIISSCNQQWLHAGGCDMQGDEKQPIFVVGLPRTGTTLVERILSSHSAIESAGELKFFGLAVKRAAGMYSKELIDADIISAAVTKPIEGIAAEYLKSASYLFGDKPRFIDKLPDNIFYLGFIAKAFPKASIIHLRRHPLDACLAIYKQLFAGAYKFSYAIEELAKFYIDYQRLMKHWRNCLGERLIEVDYEALVFNQDKNTRFLLEKLGLPFEVSCLNFQDNSNSVATASASQVREKIHTRSVGKWQHYATELEPLRQLLVAGGVPIE